MADTYKVLGQVAPAITTLTTLYTVPAATSTTVSSLVVCNTGLVCTFRASVAVAGAADNIKQYLYYDISLGIATTMVATLGITLAATDVVKCYSSLGTTSFSLFGVEIT
jgi:hypothetical protein